LDRFGVFQVRNRRRGLARISDPGLSWLASTGRQLVSVLADLELLFQREMALDRSIELDLELGLVAHADLHRAAVAPRLSRHSRGGCERPGHAIGSEGRERESPVGRLLDLLVLERRMANRHVIALVRVDLDADPALEERSDAGPTETEE